MRKIVCDLCDDEMAYTDIKEYEMMLPNISIPVKTDDLGVLGEISIYVRGTQVKHLDICPKCIYKIIRAHNSGRAMKTRFNTGVGK